MQLHTMCPLEKRDQMAVVSTKYYSFFRHLHHLPLSVPFRKTFLYSNMGSMLVAYVIEKLGGASWDTLMVDKLLSPLGMSQSRALNNHKELEGTEFAKPYVPVDGNLTACDTQLFE